MRFERPLKVFLSYSHDDEKDHPLLFKHFTNHLKPLEDDRLIARWDDRRITVGTDWDKEIKSNVHECDLFIALTSANFHASKYIEGIEMKVARERHQRSECRIVPVMWRAWRPPATFSLLSKQFLPSLDRDVVNSPNTDAELKTLTVNIEKLVQEMTGGAWTWDSSRIELLPPDLPYLCNWTRPIQRLVALEGSGARRPRVLVLIGSQDDCADAFLRRTIRADLQRALNLDTSAAVHDIQLMDWPADASSVCGGLDYVLEAPRNRTAEQKLRPGLTIIKTVTEGWSAAKRPSSRA